MTQKIFEKIWLLIVALCAVIFVYNLVQKGLGDAYIWLIWMILSLLFFFRRRKIRMKSMKE